MLEGSLYLLRRTAAQQEKGRLSCSKNSAFSSRFQAKLGCKAALDWARRLQAACELPPGPAPPPGGGGLATVPPATAARQPCCTLPALACVCARERRERVAADPLPPLREGAASHWVLPLGAATLSRGGRRRPALRCRSAWARTCFAAPASTHATSNQPTELTKSQRKIDAELADGFTKAVGLARDANAASSSCGRCRGRCPGRPWRRRPPRPS